MAALNYMKCNVRKRTFRYVRLRRFKSACASVESDLNLHLTHFGQPIIQSFFMQTTEALTRLRDAQADLYLRLAHIQSYRKCCVPAHIWDGTRNVPKIPENSFSHDVARLLLPSTWQLLLSCNEEALVLIYYIPSEWKSNLTPNINVFPNWSFFSDHIFVLS